MRILVLTLSLAIATTAGAAPCGPRGAAYAFNFGRGSVWISDGKTFEEFAVAKKRYGKDFLWVKLHGRTYVIKNAATLGRVHALFAPVRALEPEIERVSREEEALDRQMDAISDGPEEEKDEALLEKLRARAGEIRKRERALDRREEELSCTAEKSMWPVVEEAIRSGMAQSLSR